MSYTDEKRRCDRRLIAMLHPGFPVEEPGDSDGPPDFNGGARMDYSPRPGAALDRIALAQQGVFGPDPNPEDTGGWPVEYEIADGARLLFPGLTEKE